MDEPLNLGTQPRRNAATVAGQGGVPKSRLFAAVAAHAATLPVPILRPSQLFNSMLMGGFECATHHHRPGRRRLDLSAATGHAAHTAQDYSALSAHGLHAARDGLRWHLIEQVPGHYDWSSFLPMLEAARATGTQVIWDLCHYGWPDFMDIWSPDFPRHFADFAHAAAQLIAAETGNTAHYVPINEISFWAWAGASAGFINPHAQRRGGALKTVLIKAAIAASAAIRAADPQARILAAEPAIHVEPYTLTTARMRAARLYSGAQFEALDALTGRTRPELGGHPGMVDIIGLNYYIDNQWFHRSLPLPIDDDRYRPFRDILQAVHARYGKPVIVSETGVEGDQRAAWLRIIATEVAAAQGVGIPVEGLCLYFVTDYPGWADGRLCKTGLFGLPGPTGARPVHAPLAQELALLQAAMAPAT